MFGNAGLLPAAVQLLLIFPLSGKGVGGISLGYCMPLFVILFNTVFWSFPAYAWFTLTGQCIPLQLLIDTREPALIALNKQQWSVSAHAD